LFNDLAGKHRATHSEAALQVDPDVVASDFAQLQRAGYVILPSLLDASELAHLRAALTPLLDHTGRNAFEGHKTQRVYGVPAKTRATDGLIAHPRVHGHGQRDASKTRVGRDARSLVLGQMAFP
jgi:hypothetical protein